MNDQINLLVDKKKILIAHKKLVKILRIISLGLLSFISIIAITIFIVKSQSKLETLHQREKTILSNIELLRPRGAKFVLINDRIRNISEILKKRPDFEKKLSMILAEFPQDVAIESMEIKNNEVLIEGESQSLQSVGILFDRVVLLAQAKEIFSSVTLDELNASSGRYTFILKGE